MSEIYIGTKGQLNMREALICGGGALMKIRQAVGAVVFQNDKYLLVHKIKSMNSNTDILGHWDFSKGGVNETDRDFEEAVLRELREETGSENYRIVSSFDKKICFTFPQGHKYDKQETVMFYVEYLGDRSELGPQDEEIDEVKFFSKDELMRAIQHDETQEFLNEVFNKI